MLDKSKENVAKCIFGSEPEEESAMGRAIVTDFIPIFYPIASIEHGYVYVTDEYLLSRAKDVLSVIARNDYKLYEKNEGSGSISIGIDEQNYIFSVNMRQSYQRKKGLRI